MEGFPRPEGAPLGFGTLAVRGKQRGLGSERLSGVLLDHEDRLPAPTELLDDPEDLAEDERREGASARRAASGAA